MKDTFLCGPDKFNDHERLVIERLLIEQCNFGLILYLYPYNSDIEFTFIFYFIIVIIIIIIIIIIVFVIILKSKLTFHPN